MLQRSHALTRVESSFPTGTSSTKGRFNGATRSRAWKGPQTADHPRIPMTASTEPRAHARGKEEPRSFRADPSVASTEPRAHARGKYTKVTVDFHLNDKASTEPRAHARGKASPKPPPSSRSSELQRSHALTRVERRALRFFWTRVSMLQRSHALTRVESKSARPGPERSGCFNGATRSRAWKGRRAAEEATWPDKASTEPRAHARGKPTAFRYTKLAHGMLQRSHALTRVERTARRVLGLQQREASTEPRAHARGKPRVSD